MKIDFTFSIQDWMEQFEKLFSIIENFFSRLGIKLFADEEETTTGA
jgi:hypothetical protein